MKNVLTVTATFIAIAIGVILFLVFTAFVILDDREQIQVYAVSGFGSDPGTYGQGQVAWVEYQGKKFDRDWYINNHSSEWIINLVWVSPDHIYIPPEDVH